MSLLIIERGIDIGKRLPLKKFPITIGRDQANDITLSDDEISRYHLRIKQRGRLYIIEDLGSRNGTYLNGDKIVNSTIHSGDKIMVGSTELTFLASEPDIVIAEELFPMDFDLAKGLGMRGPMHLGEGGPDGVFTPKRFDPKKYFREFQKDSEGLKQLSEISGNLLVIESLEEASQSLIKTMGSLFQGLERGALLIWVAATRSLVPYAVKSFAKKPGFQISRRAMEDVISRKKGIILTPEPGDSQTPLRLVVPMINGGQIVAIIHLEFRPGTNIDPHLPAAQSIINHVSPFFETMILKRELDSWMMGMIETMVATVEAKDTYTRGHSDRVSRYCMVMADELKLKRDVKRNLMMSALCHDIGKIGIPDAILKKASLLSAEEYEEMKLHPIIGADIVSHMPNVEKFMSGVKYHHEKWDGTGYPDGLEGEEIPFFGRIVAIADTFDAMVSGRSYSGFMDEEAAITKIEEEIELFDPDILHAFIKGYDSGALKIKTSTLSNQKPDDEDS